MEERKRALHCLLMRLISLHQNDFCDMRDLIELVSHERWRITDLIGYSLKK